MQTFLPYADFRRSAEVLDYRRLGKQRVEARTIYEAIIEGNGWQNHPAVVMWRPWPDALAMYYNFVVMEWKRRGYVNSMEFIAIKCQHIAMPAWLGDEEFHASHRSNLLRKDKKFYSKFGWGESDDLEYVWPSKLARYKSYFPI